MIAITASGSSDLIRAIASLAWPVLVFTSVVIFRPQVRDLLSRIEEITVGSVKARTRKLKVQAEKLPPIKEARQVPPPSLTEPAPAEPQSKSVGESNTVTQEVLMMAVSSPTAALIQLAGSLEREGRRLLATTGHLLEIRPQSSLLQIAAVLERATQMPRGSLDAFRTFADIRNRVVHGRGNVSDDEIRQAIDSGLILLRALLSVPRERNVVYHPGVPIFGDEELKHQLPGFGVILETTSPGGVVVNHRIFPTTRTHFWKGMEVTWEWSGDHSWSEAWYSDPDSGETKVAWSASMEFTGRNLDDV